MNKKVIEIEDSNFAADDGADSTTTGITPLYVLLAVLKRPWIVAVFLFLILLPLIYYISKLVPIYRSSALVMISVKGVGFPDAINFANRSGSEIRTQKYYSSILESRAFKDDVVQVVRQIIWKNINVDSLAATARSSIGFINNVREEEFITVYSQSRSPEVALKLAKIALERFQGRSIELERQEAQNIVNFIDQQISHLNAKLEDAESQLHSFLATKKLIIDDMELGVRKQLFDLEKQLSESQANLDLIDIIIESYTRQVKELNRQFNSEAVGSDNNQIYELKSKIDSINAELNSLTQDESNLERIQTLQSEKNTIRSRLAVLTAGASGANINNQSYIGITLQKLEDELENALLEKDKYENQVNFFLQQIEKFKAENPHISKDVLEYAGLIRARDVLVKTLDILLEKREEARIKVASEMGGIKVIDEPQLPQRPIPRKKTLKFIIGFLAALGLGVFASTIVDRFDNTIRDEADVSQSLGIPVFGTIPMLEPKPKTLLPLGNPHHESEDGDLKLNERLLIKFSEKSPVSEAYRSLKTSLLFLAEDRHMKSFVITSPGAAEGKSLTTANLAISFTQGGKDILIIDADLRRPVQHKNFGMKRKPGLTDYLFGEASLDEIIRPTAIAGLTLIPSGTSPPNPAELLASRKMKQFLEEIRDRFELILIDTPPLMACVDSRVLAKSTDGMIMLAKVESTNINALSHALNQTQRLNVEVLGVILNQAGYRYGATYYYAYRYYRPYSYYSGYNYYYYYEEADKSGKKHKKRTPKETTT